MGSDAGMEHTHVVEIDKKGKRGSKRRLPGLINHVLRRRIVQCERDLRMRGNHPEDGLEWFSAVSSLEQAPASAQTPSPASSPSPPSPVRQQHSAAAACLCDSASRDSNILRQLNGMEKGKGDLPLDLARRLAVLAEQYQQQQQQQQQQYGNMASLMVEQACLEEMRMKRRRVYSDFATIPSPTSIDSVIHALAQAPRRPALDHGAFGRLLSAETVINDDKLLGPQPIAKPLPMPDLVLPPLSQALQLLRQDAEPRPFVSPSHASPGLDALALLSRNLPVKDTWPANLRMNRVYEVQPQALSQVQQNVQAALVQYLMRNQFDSASLAMSPLLTAPVM